jgi:hypothetical protein
LLGSLETVLSRIPWPFVFSAFLAALSFSVIHYLSYMSYFDGAFLLLYPGDFYFQFCVLFSMHVAMAVLFGNVAYYGFGDAAIIAVEDVFRLRQVRFWRGIRAVRYRIRRRRYPANVIIGTLSVLFFFVSYLGVIKALLLFLISAFALIGFSFIHNSDPFFTRGSLIKSGFGSVKLLSLANLTYSTSQLISAPRRHLRLIFELGTKSIGMMLAPTILVAAATSGTLRAGNIANNMEMSVATQGETYVGVVYATSASGILMYLQDKDVSIFLPDGSFSVRSQEIPHP